MVTAQAVKKSEKKAPVKALSSEVNGNFFIYSLLLNVKLYSNLASVLEFVQKLISCQQPHFETKIKLQLLRWLFYYEF